MRRFSGAVIFIALEINAPTVKPTSLSTQFVINLLQNKGSLLR